MAADRCGRSRRVLDKWRGFPKKSNLRKTNEHWGLSLFKVAEEITAHERAWYCVYVWARPLLLGRVLYYQCWKVWRHVGDVLVMFVIRLRCVLGCSSVDGCCCRTFPFSHESKYVKLTWLPKSKPTNRLKDEKSNKQHGIRYEKRLVFSSKKKHDHQTTPSQEKKDSLRKIWRELCSI